MDYLRRWSEASWVNSFTWRSIQPLLYPNSWARICNGYFVNILICSAPADYLDTTVSFHGLCRIDNDIHHHLVQPDGIPVNWRQFLFQLHFDCDVVENWLMLQHSDSFVYDLIESYQFHLIGCLMGKLKKISNDNFAALGLMNNCLQIFIYNY